MRELKAVNSVELPQEIVDRFNYTYPYSDATRRTAKISVSELKRRFQEREIEAGTIDTLNEPIVTVDTGAKRAVSDTILGQAIKLDVCNVDSDATSNAASNADSNDTSKANSDVTSNTAVPNYYSFSR